MWYLEVLVNSKSSCAVYLASEGQRGALVLILLLQCFVSFPLKMPDFLLSWGQLRLYKTNVNNVSVSLDQVPCGDTQPCSLFLS